MQNLGKKGTTKINTYSLLEFAVLVSCI